MKADPSNRFAWQHYGAGVPVVTLLEKRFLWHNINKKGAHS